MIIALFLPYAAEYAYCAAVSPVEVVSINIDPRYPVPGQQLSITARTRRTATQPGAGPLAVTVIAVVVRPDNIVKSWVWKNVSLGLGKDKEFSVPEQIQVKQPGRYTVEFNIYSADIRRRYAKRTMTFTAGDTARRSRPAEEVISPERYAAGIGLFGNALNAAGGGCFLLWPFRSFGFQAIHTDGTFTSTEGRLLVRFNRSSGVNPYIGAGYLHVRAKESIIGIPTEFGDRSISGVVGLEVPISRRILGYVEVSAASIDLEKTVTNGALAVKATVEYAPVSIGFGIVLGLF